MTFELVEKNETDKICQTKSLEPLEKKMLNLPQIDCPVSHRFGPGIYMREVFMPKGSIILGHHQNLEHVNIFIKGRLTFFSENGERIEMQAPLTFTAKPGRKLAYIHEDAIWMNVYATEETDIEKLEEKYLTKSETWISETSRIDNAQAHKLEIEQGETKWQE